MNSVLDGASTDAALGPSYFNFAALDGGVLKPHQADGISFLVEHSRCLLADEVGLGKTVQALGLIAHLAETEPGRVLVVTPAHMIRQWRHEAERFVAGFALADSTEKAIASPTPAQRIAYQQQPPDVLIASYDFVASHVDSLERECFSLVVFDEAAAEVKGGGAQYEKCLRLSTVAGRVVVMTATPLENDPMELWRLLNLAGTSGLWAESRFKNEYVIWREGYQHPRVPNLWIPPQPIDLRPERVEEVRDYLAKHVLRLTEDVLDAPLPRRVGPEIVWVPPTPDQMDALHLAEQEPHPGMRNGHIEKILGGDGAAPTVAQAAVRFLIDDCQEDQVVLWAYHKAHLDLVEEMLAEASIGYVRIDGDVTQTGRAKLVEQFRSDPEIHVLLGTDALATGLNLQNARVVLSLGGSYNPAKVAQLAGRVRRLGSRHETYICTSFLTDCDFERGRFSTAERKTRLFNDLFGSATLGDEFPAVLDQIPAEIQRVEIAVSAGVRPRV